MTINGLLISSAKELALPCIITDEPVVHLPDHPQLADVTSFSLNHMRAQVKVIVDPTREGIGISIYGDPKVADEVNICSRGGHAALGDLNRSNGAYGSTCEILLVITVPSRVHIDTHDFAGKIGIGGVPAEMAYLNIHDNVEVYVECATRLRLYGRDDSVVEVDTVTSELDLSLYGRSTFSAQRAYGRATVTTDAESQFHIHSGILTSAEFISTGSGMSLYGGIVAGETKLEQHGSGQMALYVVRQDCAPNITGSGTVSFNGKVYRNK